MSVVKERPILFNGAMVRAILEGQKTVTRRVMKPQPGVDQHGFMRWQHKGVLIAEQNAAWAPFEKGFPAAISDGLLWLCPYGKPGDRLWVRETWSPDPEDDGTWGYTQWAGCKGSPLTDIPKRFQKPEHCIHRASWGGADLVWRPSIHMPRWACRILLEVIAVRVERLQDISEKQAEAEGVNGEPCDHARQACSDICCWGDTAKGAFGFLWESLNGQGSWNANPWVWVVEFKRIEQ